MGVSSCAGPMVKEQLQAMSLIGVGVEGEFTALQYLHGCARQYDL